MTYQYKCMCGNLIEKNHGMNEKIVVFCDCGNIMNKVFTPPAIKFNGKGFYVNDYKER